MKTVVGLVNYGVAGNIFSMKKALEISGATVKIVETCKDFSNIDKIVLPGVGSFNDAMEEIENDGIKEVLIEMVNTKHTLGICLGMQILVNVGFEFFETKGLGILEGESRKLNVSYKIPHIGWTNIEVARECPLFRDINENDSYYFIHSLEVVKSPGVIAFSRYNDYRFVSGIHDGNGVFGLQFHPEKSREQGIRILRNFINL